MSTPNLSVSSRGVKRRRQKNGRTIDPTDFPARWRELVDLEAAAPPGLRGGIARARTALLNGVEPWRLPEILENLMTGGQPA
jgi:hypothetical protein